MADAMGFDEDEQLTKSEMEETRIRGEAGLDAIEEEESEKPSTQEAKAPTLEQKQTSSSTEEKPTTEQTTEEQPRDQEFPWDEGFDLGDAARNIKENALAVPYGVADFGVDLINLIPGIEIDKLPKFNNRAIQAVRDIASFVVPTIATGGLVGVAGKAAVGAKALQGAKATKLLADPFMRFTLRAGQGAVAGAAVDSVNSLNETDDNLAGSLKKSFPDTFDWIPDSYATLDTDDPDTKRQKNMWEGIGLGLVTDVAMGATKFFNALNQTRVFTSAKKLPPNAKGYVAENKQAADYFAKNVELDPTEPTEAVIDSASRRSDSMDELGLYNLSKDPEMALERPTLGLQDAFDFEESGIRSVDPYGVVGASVDLTRVADNIGTVNGRVGSFLTDSAIDYVNAGGTDAQRQVIEGLVGTIRDAGNYGYKVPGYDLIKSPTIKRNLVTNSVEQLADILRDPTLTREDFTEALSPYMMTTADGKNFLDPTTGAPRVIDDVLQEELKLIKDMDNFTVQALANVSLSGQVSDIAEGFRYMDDTTGMTRNAEEIIDRVTYLMGARGSSASMAGTFLQKFNRKNVRQTLSKAEATQEADFLSQMQAKSWEDANAMNETLKRVARERPAMLKPLLLAMEVTNGSVKDLASLNKYVSQNLVRIDQALLKGNAEFDNQFVQSMWSNIYNSVLSSLATPTKAAIGNLGGIVARPLTIMGGAAMARDTRTMQEGFAAFSAVGDTLQKATGYMRQIFSMASKDPTSLQSMLRSDLQVRNTDQIETLQVFADQAAKEGNPGPAMMMEQLKALNDLAEHPVLRFGTNAMTAFDGFTRSVIANGEARHRAYLSLVEQGITNPSRAQIKEVSDKIYNSMIGKDGLIRDGAVEFQSADIALSADNKLANQLGNLTEQSSLLKSIFMFPRTSMNMIGMVDKYSPISVFAREYNDLTYKPFNQWSIDEMQEVLTKYGHEIPTGQGAEQQIMSKFNFVRSEAKGRKAIGTLAVMSAGMLYMQGRLRGNGVYDKEEMLVRRDLNIGKNEIQGPDGNWYSFAGLGPVSDIMSFMADVMDNSDMLGETATENLLNKAGFLISANITNKSVLSNMEVLFSLTQGDGRAINRWGAGLVNSLGPLAGARKEWGRIMQPQIRELDGSFQEELRKANTFMDAANPNAGLPVKHDWLYGDIVAYNENPFVRAWNAVSPMKVRDGTRPEAEFLGLIEFDTRPTFNTDGKGVTYTPTERAELYAQMGKDGYFLKEVQAIMKDAETLKYVERLRAYRAEGVSSERVDISKFEMIHTRLERALNKAKTFAEAQLPDDMRTAIEDRRIQAQVLQRSNQRGYDLDETLSIYK